MPACTEGERTEHFTFCLRISIFPDRGRCFRGIGTFDGGDFGRFMPLGQEGKRTAPFHGLGGRGGAGFGGSLPSAAALLVYACQRGGRASELNFVFSPLDFLGPRGGVFDGSLPTAGPLLIYSCQRVGRANGVSFLFLRFCC